MSADGATGRGAGARPPFVPAAEVPDYPGLLRRVPAIVYTAAQGIDGGWSYVSPQIEAILGFSPAEWCADPGIWRRQLHPDDAERILSGEHSPKIDANGAAAIEYRLLHRDGHSVWVRDDAVLQTSPDGHLVWDGVLSDITERKVAETQLERSAAQHAAVAALGEHALEGLSGTELAAEAIAAAVALLGVDFGGVLELDAARGHFRFLASHGLDDAVVTVGVPFDPATQPGYAVTHGRVIVTDWTTEQRFAPTAPVRDGGVLSGMTILVEGRGGPFGVLGVHCASARDFSAMEIDFVQALANVLSDAFARQRTEEDIRHRALHDPLTGLPNRTLFMDRLGQAVNRMRRHAGRAAILFLDVDRFKLVNESLGHDIGDELLAAAAPRLKQTMRAADTVARFGADEFGILLEDIAGEHDAVDMAQRIAAVFTRPFVLGGDEHFVTTSIGISLALGGEPPEALIRDAETAMYRAKERGGARYELFDEALRGRAMGRLRVENDLRRALERGEFTLDYQPIVGLRDRRIAGVEALVRWEHPDRGRIPPLEFIPVAEENGLIEPIGRWVLEQACRQAAAWCAARPDAAPISVAVNLSAVQFDNTSLPDTVAGALRAAGLDPSLLALEITESVLMDHGEKLARTLSALKKIGAGLVLDDFGTGFSSLSYLSRLPLDVLKVDRSFVDGLGTERSDTAIAEAIVAMAHALSLDVVGEGAETAVQISELERLGCDRVQGFFFSRPVPAAQIERLLRDGGGWSGAPGSLGAELSVQGGHTRLQR